ncbi:MAG: glycosyltransferase [Methylococcales bacterium]
MNIGHIISTGGFYGAEKVILELAQHQTSIGQNVTLGVLPSPGADKLIEEANRVNVKSEILQYNNDNLFSQIKSIKLFVKKYKLNVIHSHSYKTNILLGVSRIRGCLKLTTCHTWYSDNFKLKLYEYLDKILIKIFFDHIVVVSPQLKIELLNFKVNENKISMIENGLSIIFHDTESCRDKYRKIWGLSEDQLLMVRVGRLAYDKGNDVLLKALKELKHLNIVLVFLGEGPEYESLVKLTKQFNLSENVKFLGFRDDVAEILYASDVFVSPSFKEGLPMVLLEAMAAKICIVSTDVGAISDLLTSDVNSILIKPKQIIPLSEAIEKVASDKKLRINLGQSAYDLYKSNYSRESMGARYNILYEKLLEKY